MLKQFSYFWNSFKTSEWTRIQERTRSNFALTTSAPFAIPKDMKIMKLREKALKLRYLYSVQFISWATRIMQPMLQWLGYTSQCRNHVFGSMQKGQALLTTRSNLQSNSSTGVRGPEPSTCRVLLLTSYCTINVSMGGANSSPYTGKLKNPHKVAILIWDSFAELYLEIRLKDFVPTMYWN